MRFVDEVSKVVAQGGAGGNGCSSFRRTRSRPRGGPDGGDGGDGGDVVLEGTSRMETLEDFLYTPLWRAENGEHGQGNGRKGRRGRDLTVYLPLGTVVKDHETKAVLFEMLEDGQRFILGKGGKGGYGNARFATSTNQAPRWASPGQKGQTQACSLELKLLSDLGFVGMPSAGKSSLLRALTRAMPKVAAYPFTTTAPVLGVLTDEGTKRCTIADMPGLIEGAHQGRGLGIRFLRHIERSKALVVVLDAALSDPTPKRAFEIVRDELSGYNPALLARIQAVLLNKIDLVVDGSLKEYHEEFFRTLGFEVISVSARYGTNIESLVHYLLRTT
jgi:GTP-binding protein